MKVLIAGLSQSIHTFRWVEQFRESGHEIILVCTAPYIFPKAARVYDWCRVIDLKKDKRTALAIDMKRKTLGVVFRQFSGMPPIDFALLHYIVELQPDLVHTMPFQEAAYPLLNIRAELIRKKRMPLWLATNWGSDIYYWRHHPFHLKKIRSILALCDYYSCENDRDLRIAQELGLQGHAFDPFPNAGGLDLMAIGPMREKTLPSSRQLITLKGYNDHWGRATVGLVALARCSASIRRKGLRIVINNPETAVLALAARLRERLGLDIVTNDYVSHQQILETYANSRIAIGLSLSDGNSTSMLEALAMGAFPIQSNTAAVDEWFVDGQSGFSVPPEEVDVIASAIEQAISDDVLVDNAHRLNWQTTVSRLDYTLLRKKSLAIYDTIATRTG